MQSGIEILETATSKAFRGLRGTCICLIALAVLCACTQISGAAAGDLRMESGTDEYQTLAQGESWDLGYEGYVLTVRQIDLEAPKIWLSMLKDGKEVDSDVLGQGDTYIYETDIDGIEYIIFKAKVRGLFRGTDANMVQLMDFHLYSDGSSNVEPTASHTVSPTTIEYLRITANVNNGYAITIIEEKLTNPHNIATDDEFRFLIPDSAFISGFSLFIDGVEYEADVLPKEDADERFEAAVSEGRTAGVLKTKKENI
ncbi:MAG: S-layer protein domain-containing protein, partial [Euryarchaeota archaeon]|nr:S-layer protein domain-containing protein [Euryarchaeota archaeon]